MPEILTKNVDDPIQDPSSMFHFVPATLYALPLTTSNTPDALLQPGIFQRRHEARQPRAMPQMPKDQGLLPRLPAILVELSTPQNQGPRHVRGPTRSRSTTSMQNPSLLHHSITSLSYDDGLNDADDVYGTMLVAGWHTRLGSGFSSNKITSSWFSAYACRSRKSNGDVS